MSWYEHAECRGLTHLFFADNHSNYDPRARLLCARCPVRAECAEAGKDEVYGLWGGMSPSERGARTGGGRKRRDVRAESVRLSKLGMPDSAVARRLGASERNVKFWRQEAGMWRGAGGTRLEDAS